MLLPRRNRLKFWAYSPAQIAQVRYRALKPYKLEYQPEWLDLTDTAKTVLSTLTSPSALSRDAGADLVRYMLARKGRDCLFRQDFPDTIGRYGYFDGGCLDVVLEDGRLTRYLFGCAERLVPEPTYCTPTEALIAAADWPGDFERNLARSRLLPPVPARWLATRTKTVPWLLLTLAGGASGCGATLLLLSLR